MLVSGANDSFLHPLVNPYRPHPNLPENETVQPPATRKHCHVRRHSAFCASAATGYRRLFLSRLRRFGASFGEQERDQIVEIGFRNDLGDIVGHQRQGRFHLLINLLQIE